MTRASGLATLTWVLVAIVSPTLADDAVPLKLVADVRLSGETTRFDYASLDAAAHRLYIAHLGDSVVTVFDTENQTVIAEIPKIGHVHGVLAVPELGRVYASATQTDEVVAIDTKTLQIGARMPGGIYPDGMAYVPEIHRLFVSDEIGTTETVINTETGKRIDTIHLRSVVGNTQYDPVSKHVFVAAQTRDQLVEIDPVSDRIVAKYDLKDADGPHGVLIDADHRLAFVACEGNDRLVVFDLRQHQAIASFSVGKDPDVLALDASLHRLYVTGEQGVVSVFGIDTDSVHKIGEGFVGPNAHVVAVDPTSHRVYFPLKNVDGHPVLRVMEPPPG